MLLQNTTILGANPITNTGGILAGESVFRGIRDQTWLNVFAGAGFNKKSAIPEGYKPDAAWFSALQAGGLAAVSELVLSGSVALAAGRNMEASASLALSVSNATLDQIVSLSASSSMALSSNADVSSVVLMVASSSMTLAVDAALLGAIFSLTASSSMTLTGTAGQGAVAWMEAGPIESDELTPESLAEAVWAALTIDNQEPGSQGAMMTKILKAVKTAIAVSA